MKHILSVTLLTLLISSCSTYKMEVQQGNALSNETVSQLKQGMSKSEVASLLGTPLLQDNFRNNRWDYVYFTKKGNQTAAPKGITLLFKNEQLIIVKK